MYADSLKDAIADERDKLIEHPLYKQVHSVEQLKIFVQYHVFAVWDFMSLLKSLQQKLTCVTTPWYPIGSANTRYLINEIVLGEESDVDEQGERTSHFELYLQAMQQMGAGTGQINEFIQQLQKGKDIKDVISNAEIPAAIKTFLLFTFDVIAHQPAHVQAAVFTFGREDLIPAMFMGMVKDLSTNEGDKLSIYKYYLERHIEVDGDHHSHLALQMVEELCGNDAIKWKEATSFALRALQHRKALWDGTLQAIQKLLTPAFA